MQNERKLAMVIRIPGHVSEEQAQLRAQRFKAGTPQPDAILPCMRR